MSVRDILRRHGHHPRRSLGQNFLLDPGIAARIVDALAPESRDAVLEIGSGTGALTGLLAERAGYVLGVEVDYGLYGILTEALADRENLDLVLGDVRDAKMDRLYARGNRRFLVLGNLPYCLSSEILFFLLEHGRMIDRAVLTFQREVADRIRSKPGGKEYGILSVLVQADCEVDKVMSIPPPAFYPRPDVDSTVLLLRFTDPPPQPVSDRALFARLVRAGFGQRRKTLRNALSQVLSELSPGSDSKDVLSAAGIDPGRRAETLSVPEWAGFADYLHEHK